MKMDKLFSVVLEKKITPLGNIIGASVESTGVIFVKCFVILVINQYVKMCLHYYTCLEMLFCVTDQERFIFSSFILKTIWKNFTHKLGKIIGASWSPQG